MTFLSWAQGEPYKASNWWDRGTMKLVRAMQSVTRQTLTLKKNTTHSLQIERCHSSTAGWKQSFSLPHITFCQLNHIRSAPLPLIAPKSLPSVTLALILLLVTEQFSIVWSVECNCSNGRTAALSSVLTSFIWDVWKTGSLGIDACSVTFFELDAKNCNIKDVRCPLCLHCCSY